MKLQKKLLLSFILALLIIVSVSCGTALDPTARHVQEGYIVDYSDERIFVVSHIDQEDINELTEDELLEKSMEGSDDRNLIAVWYTVNNPEDYELGQYVRVRSRELMDSWPQQAYAARVTVIDEP